MSYCLWSVDEIKFNKFAVNNDYYQYPCIYFSSWQLKHQNQVLKRLYNMQRLALLGYIFSNQMFLNGTNNIIFMSVMGFMCINGYWNFCMDSGIPDGHIKYWQTGYSMKLIENKKRHLFYNPTFGTHLSYLRYFRGTKFDVTYGVIWKALTMKLALRYSIIAMMRT